MSATSTCCMNYESRDVRIYNKISKWIFCVSPSEERGRQEGSDGFEGAAAGGGAECRRVQAPEGEAGQNRGRAPDHSGRVSPQRPCWRITDQFLA